MPEVLSATKLERINQFQVENGYTVAIFYSSKPIGFVFEINHYGAPTGFKERVMGEATLEEYLRFKKFVGWPLAYNGNYFYKVVTE